MTEFGQDIASYTLVPSTGGVHEFELDGELVFSKKQLGRQPTGDEIAALVRARLATVQR